MENTQRPDRFIEFPKWTQGQKWIYRLMKVSPMPAQAASTRREPTPKRELTNWQVRDLPSQGNNPRIESEPGWYLRPISFPKSVSELNPLLHCSLTKASVLGRQGCSDYSRRGKRWKGQVSLSLCEISQQFLEWTHYCLSFSLGSLKQGPSPRPSGKLTTSQLRRYSFQNEIQNLWVWLWEWNMWSWSCSE